MDSHNYLKFDSNNPQSHKKSVASSLFRRASVLCSDENKDEENR